MSFSPNVNDAIIINSNRYCFTEHPSAKGMPYGQTGRRATVYQVKAQDDTIHALKVFSQAFRSVRHAENVNRLLPFTQLPGLQACQRFTITPQNEKKLVSEHPDLTYSVLMPWVNGETWQEFMLSQRSLSPQQCLILARSFAVLLENMEQRGVAQCDLSGPNVMISVLLLSGKTQKNGIALVDVDDLYAPGLPRPEKLPGGSPGYAHKTAPQGLWSAEADRFAATVLIAEMLTWHDKRIRQQSFGEQFFDPAEIQKDCPRYQLMLEVLSKQYEPPIAAAFRQAWQSQTLIECPPLSHWPDLLNTQLDATASEFVESGVEFEMPTFKPAYKPIGVASSTSTDGSARTVSSSPQKSIDKPAVPAFYAAPIGRTAPVSPNKNVWIWILSIVSILIVCGVISTGTGGYFLLNNSSSPNTDISTEYIAPAIVVPSNTPYPKPTTANVQPTIRTTTIPTIRPASIPANPSSNVLTICLIDTAPARTEPSKTSTLIEWAQKGDCMRFDGRFSADDGVWLRIQDNQEGIYFLGHGWIRSDHLSVNQSEINSLPAVSP